MNKKVSLLLVALLILSVFVNPLISTAEMRVDKDLGFIEEIGEIQFVNESFFTIDEGMALSSNEMSVISEENWELTQEEIEWVSLEGVKQDDTMFSEELYGNYGIGRCASAAGGYSRFAGDKFCGLYRI